MFVQPFRDLVACDLLAAMSLVASICGSIHNVNISANVAVSFRRRIAFQEIRKRQETGGISRHGRRIAWPIFIENDISRREPVVHDSSQVISFVERAKDSMFAA